MGRLTKAKKREILGNLLQEYGRTEPQQPLPFVDTIIAIILSQNTSDVNSHKAYESLVARFDDWRAVAAAPTDEVVDAIRVGGLAAQKGATIQALLDRLAERFDDFRLDGIEEIDDDALLSWLVETKGIGRKTASCAMMFALSRDLCAVDTHLHRLLNRIGIVKTGSPDATFDALRPHLLSGKAGEIHVALIRFGRHTCKARNPHCFECPVYNDCTWPDRKAYAAEGKRGADAISGDFLITDGIGRKETKKV